MAKKFATNTNAFTIAHYILLFLVVVFCVVIIAWVMIKNHNQNPVNSVRPGVVHVQNTDPCVQRIRDVVARMWAYNPEMVPQKYWDMAMEYLNEPIASTTYGICQDVAFTCRVGQIRRECDPCAVPSARDWAQSVHVADMIKQNCGANITANATESVPELQTGFVE